jgi:hypothetical protein
VRDPAALTRLPTDERLEWQQLWADVDALLKKLPPQKGLAPAVPRRVYETGS